MISAAVADLDGLGIFVPGDRGQELYWDFHHKVGHNLAFGTLVAIGLSGWCRTRAVLTFIACLALFHLHLFLDYWGSGRDWDIHYLWPSTRLILRNPAGWELYSWQNMVTFAVLLLWTIQIAWVKRRTPLELLMPKLDRKFVVALRPGSDPV